MADREMRFDTKMSDAEAMMWNVEHDPRLSSNIGSITICDRPLDFDYLRRKIAVAVAEIPRLRERVAPVLGRLAPPVWISDREFELDYHFRRVALPEPGSERQLYDLCCTLLREPFDRTRPLWLFVVIDGLQGERGALFSKLHHTVTDGEGGVRLAERYMDLEADPAPPPEVDLAEILDAAPDGAGDDNFTTNALNTATHTLRRVLGIVRRTVGEAALVAADPPRIAEAVSNVTKAVESARGQLGGSGPGSPLWKDRSRRRDFGVLDVPFEAAREAAKGLGGSLNDFFVAGAAIGAMKYHEFYDVEVPFLNATFVVSTRNDASAGGNAFTPSIVRIEGGKKDPVDRFNEIKDAMGARRGEVTGGADLMGALSGLANLLPTSVVTGIGRSQAAKLDFATSNVRGAPFHVSVGRAKAEKFYPMGPVAGTAWNITMMSYAGTLFMGVHTDPAAVSDLDLLIRSIEDGYRELFAAAGIPAG
jgi:WS/DGAT/MGAT family acyltransferase